MTFNEKKCFRLVQEIVCLRDRVCRRCGMTPISGHHVFGRRNHGSSFEPDSCLGLCPDCHDHWARTWPLEVQDLLREKIGEERYNYLARLSSQTVRLREKDFRDIAIKLGRKLAEMKGKG
jgi:5-methylcytosine-specific restriction endonuclease McrA